MQKKSYLCTRKIANGHLTRVRMKKTLTLIAVFVLLLCGVSPMQAGAISPAKAKELASQFTLQKQVSKMEASVVFDAKDKAGRPYLYAVSIPEQGGYVLVSGDDRFANILGYSKTSLYNEQEMPENKRAWLQGYIEEMKYLESINYQPTLRKTMAEKAPIEPLIETTWGQSAPYNDLCPLDNGSRSKTGCVATAMAQLINYHIQHYDAPDSILAQIDGYETKDLKLKVDSIPAGTRIPDKSLLINSYRKNTSATDEQKEAVAKLMLYCGTSVLMNYTNSSSGANSDSVPKALISKFGFDNTAHMIYRDDYTYAIWMDSVYAELAAARPVYHSGHSSGGGHAFLIDGYKDGLFHINWGWNGEDNDYYALSVLNPDDDGQVGASSSSDGYTISQKVIIGTQINTGRTREIPICLDTYNIRVETRNDTAFVLFSAFNETGETHSFNYGIGILDEEGNITLVGKYYAKDNLPHNRGYNTVRRPVLPNVDLANTTQTIVPISREKGTTQWYTKLPVVAYVQADYDAEGVPSLTLHPAANLTAGEITVPTNKLTRETQRVNTTLTNNGEEFYGNLFLFASTDETKGKYVSMIGLTALEGSTQEVSIDWTPKNTGTYNLWIAQDTKGEKVLCSSAVTITENPIYAGKILVINGISIDGLDADSKQVDPTTGVRTYDIYADKFDGSVRVINISPDTIVCSLKVLFDQYDEATDTYINDTCKTSYKNREFTPEGYRIFNFSDRPAEVGKTYRLRLQRTDTNPKEDLDMHYLFHLRATPLPEDLENVQNDDTPCTKVLRNGQLYLLYNGIMYDVQGRKIGDIK